MWYTTWFPIACVLDEQCLDVCYLRYLCLNFPISNTSIGDKDLLKSSTWAFQTDQSHFTWTCDIVPRKEVREVLSTCTVSEDASCIPKRACGRDMNVHYAHPHTSHWNVKGEGMHRRLTSCYVVLLKLWSVRILEFASMIIVTINLIS